MEPSEKQKDQELNIGQILFKVFKFLAVLFLFLVALKLMGASFKSFKSFAESLIYTTSNPFVALFIGMLATAIVQSSSTTTSMIVTMVATLTLVLQENLASGLIDQTAFDVGITTTLSGAVFLIMGANIGTSVTSSILAFGHIGNKKQYRKAVASATVHDFFNLMVVSILFPLEYFFHLLTNMASMLAKVFYAGGGESINTKQFGLMTYTVKPVAKYIHGFIENPMVLLAISLVMLFVALRGLTKVLESYVKGKAEGKLNKVFFKSPMRALSWGVLMTVAVQSSSVTTSLVVPLVASGKAALKKVFPFLMGANIGTTVTALLASLSGNYYALVIAFVHVLFNVIGVTLFFPIKRVREIPIKLAKSLGNAAYVRRWVGIAYVIGTFFVFPTLLYFISEAF